MKKVFFLILMLPMLVFAEDEPKKEQSLKYTYKNKAYTYEIFRVGENDYRQYGYPEGRSNKRPLTINGKDHYSRELLSKVYDVELDSLPNFSYTDLSGKKISPQEYSDKLKNLPTLTKKQFEELLPLMSNPTNANTDKDADKNKKEATVCDLSKTLCAGKNGQSAYTCLYKQMDEKVVYPECKETMSLIGKSFAALGDSCGETVGQQQLCKAPGVPDPNAPINIKNVQKLNLYLCLKKLENTPVLPDDCKHTLKKVTKTFDAAALEAFPVTRSAAPSTGAGGR